MESLPIFDWKNKKKPILNTDGIRTVEQVFYPQGYTNQSTGIQPGSYVKFDFRMGNCFWDPKTARIRIRVQPVAQAGHRDAIWQLDNSAQSIISQFIIRHNGVELERNTENDSLWAMIHDANTDIETRKTMPLAGFGSLLGDGPEQNLPNCTYNTTKAFTDTALGAPSLDASANNVSPVCPSIARWRPFLCVQSNVSTPAYVVAGVYTGGDTSIQLESFHQWYSQMGTQGQEAATSESGTVAFQTWDGLINGPVGSWGFSRPIGDLAVGGMEPWMTSGTLPRWTISGGHSTRKTPKMLEFEIPLPSWIFGPPSEHGTFMPMGLFEGLEFEFQLNTYAFTVHGYPDTKNRFHPSWDPTTMLFSSTHALQDQTLSRASWICNTFEIRVETIWLPPLQTQRIMDNALSGFSLPLKLFYLCNKVRVQSVQASLQQTWQINQGFESMIALFIRIQPTIHENFPWARKHTYISGNVTYLQIVTSMERIPTQPIEGNAGNLDVDIDENTNQLNKYSYVPFLNETEKAWGRYFSSRKHTLINPTNYTISNVGFAPGTTGSNINTPYTVAATNFYGVSLSQPGATLAYVNRHIGRGMYGLDTEKVDYIANIKSGLNTVDIRPFNIEIKTDSEQYTYVSSQSSTTNSVSGVPSIQTATAGYTGASFVYFWAHYDATLSLIPGEGWRVTGRM